MRTKELYHLITLTTSDGCEKYLVCGSKTAKERWLKRQAEKLVPRLKKGCSSSTTWFGISGDFKLPTTRAYLITASTGNTLSTLIVKNKRNVLPSGIELLKHLLFPQDFPSGKRTRSFRTPISLGIKAEQVKVVNMMGTLKQISEPLKNRVGV